MSINFTNQVTSESENNNVICQQFDKQDELIIKAVTDYQAQGLHVLPFNRIKGYCTLGKEAQQAFTCSPENVLVQFKGMDVGVDRTGRKQVEVC